VAESADRFLEGPSFDADGNLYLVDIPFGRVFRVSATGAWTLVAEYEGWPNGLKIHRDGRILLADYMHGPTELDPRAGTARPVLTSRNSESFKGCNDLYIAGTATSTSRIRARPNCTIRPDACIAWLATVASTVCRRSPCFRDRAAAGSASPPLSPAGAARSRSA